MKAEHRKELETNLLADRMGSLIQKMKGGPKRGWLVYAFVAVLLVVVLTIIYLYWMNPGDATNRWIMLDKGDIMELANDSSVNNTSKAARLQIAHFQLWTGVRMLASQPRSDDREGRRIPGALDLIDGAARDFRGLLDDCKNDKEWLAEAQYGLALVEETLASVDIKRFDSAKKQYEAIALEFEGTYRGALAKARAKDLTDNGPKLLDFYKDFNKAFDLTSQDRIRTILAETQNKLRKLEPKQLNP